MAGGGIFGGGRAELLAPDSGIFCRCGWVEESSAVPPGKSEAPGDGVSSSGCEAGGGPAVSGVARLVAVAGFERHLDEPFVDLVGLG